MDKDSENEPAEFLEEGEFVEDAGEGQEGEEIGSRLDAAALRTLRDGLDEGSDNESGGVIEEVTCAGFDDETILGGRTMDAR